MCLTWYCCGLVKGIKRGEIDIELLSQVSTDELPKIKGDAQFRLLNKTINILGDLHDNPADSGAFSYVQHGGGKWDGSMQSGASATANTDVLHLEFGKNQPHNTLPPSIACYGWRRTA